MVLQGLRFQPEFCRRRRQSRAFPFFLQKYEELRPSQRESYKNTKKQHQGQRGPNFSPYVFPFWALPLSIGVDTYPQPRAMKMPGLSLSRSSLSVRARLRGIKPGREIEQYIYKGTTVVVSSLFKICGKYKPVQIYVLYRDPYNKVNVRILLMRLSSCFTKKFHRIILTHTKNCHIKQRVRKSYITNKHQNDLHI